jgi:hypothetical protein
MLVIPIGFVLSTMKVTSELFGSTGSTCPVTVITDE